MYFNNCPAAPFYWVLQSSNENKNVKSYAASKFDV